MDAACSAGFSVPPSRRAARPAGGLEPTVPLTALGSVTEHIGLIATRTGHRYGVVRDERVRVVPAEAR